MLEFLQLLVYIMGLSNNDIKTVDDGNDSSFELPLHNKLKNHWKQSRPKT